MWTGWANSMNPGAPGRERGSGPVGKIKGLAKHLIYRQDLKVGQEGESRTHSEFRRVWGVRRLRPPSRKATVEENQRVREGQCGLRSSDRWGGTRLCRSSQVRRTTLKTRSRRENEGRGCVHSSGLLSSEPSEVCEGSSRDSNEEVQQHLIHQLLEGSHSITSSWCPLLGPETSPSSCCVDSRGGEHGPFSSGSAENVIKSERPKI